MKILIVDDEQTKVQAIAQVIESVDSNISPEISMFAKDARTKLKNKKYDLVILDLALPKLATSTPCQETGLELLTEIIDHDTLYEPKKIFCLTGIKDISEDYKEIIEDKLVTLHEFDFGSERWKGPLTSEIERQLRPQVLQEILDYDIDFLIIMALKEPELSELLKLNLNWSKPEQIDDTSYVYRGKIGDQTIVASSLPRMGSTSSAIITTKLVNRFRPRYVLMGGICAGIKEQTKLGDLILASSSWNWETGKWMTYEAEKKFKIEPFHINIDPSISTIFDVNLSNDMELMTIYSKYKDDKPDNIPSFRVGPIGCGSSVVGNQEIINEIQEQDRKVLGIEMESFGVYYACHLANQPKPKFFCLKSVCDFADENKNNNFQRYSSYMSAKLLELFMQKTKEKFN